MKKAAAWNFRAAAFLAGYVIHKATANPPGRHHLPLWLKYLDEKMEIAKEL